MVSRFAAFVIWAAVAASIVFWAMRLWVKPMPAPAYATVVSTAGGFKGDLARLFGSDAAPAAGVVAAAPAVQADARFRLIGVVAPRAPAANAQGVALIATDGQPAKAYRVGTAVDGELVLQAVHARGASLGPRGQPAAVALELPVLPPPASGTLPVAVGVGPVPRPRIALPPPPPPVQPQQFVPPPPETVPPDPMEREPQPDPSDRPMYTEPTSAGRPPT